MLNHRVTLLGNIEYKNKTYPYKYSFNNGDKWVYSVTGTYLMNPRLMVFGSFMEPIEKSNTIVIAMYSMGLGRVF